METLPGKQFSVPVLIPFPDRVNEHLVLSGKRWNYPSVVSINVGKIFDLWPHGGLL